jgi:hypothetical protein
MVLTSLSFSINIVAAIFCSIIGIKDKNAICISLGGFNAALAVVNLIRIIAMVGSSID